MSRSIDKHLRKTDTNDEFMPELEESDQPQPVDLLPRVSIGTAIEMVEPSEEIEQRFFAENPHFFGDLRMRHHDITETAFEGMILMYSLLW